MIKLPQDTSDKVRNQQENLRAKRPFEKQNITSAVFSQQKDTYEPQLTDNEEKKITKQNATIGKGKAAIVNVNSLIETDNSALERLLQQVKKDFSTVGNNHIVQPDKVLTSHILEVLVGDNSLLQSVVQKKKKELHQKCKDFLNLIDTKFFHNNYQITKKDYAQLQAKLLLTLCGIDASDELVEQLSSLFEVKTSDEIDSEQKKIREKFALILLNNILKKNSLSNIGETFYLRNQDDFAELTTEPFRATSKITKFAVEQNDEKLGRIMCLCTMVQNYGVIVDLYVELLPDNNHDESAIHSKISKILKDEKSTSQSVLFRSLHIQPDHKKLEDLKNNFFISSKEINFTS